MRRMTVEGFNFPLRTDESFLARVTPHHNLADSSLKDVHTGMVSQFRLYALHLVYVDIVKRMISFLFSPPFCFEKALERAYAIDLVSDV